jgi:hypothetical protein
MKRLDVRNIGAILLIVAGVLLLFQNMGILESVVALVWALLLAAGGVVLLYLFVTERIRYWWAIIPGFALIGLAALIFLDRFLPRIGGDLGGMIFLGSLGLAFWVIYFQRREYWWAVIPGGVLITLALISGLDPFVDGDAIGGLLFVGLGLTFGVVYLLPTPYGRMRWAIFPAIVLLAMGLLVTLAAVGGSDLVFAVALIAVGLFLLVRVFRSQQDRTSGL